MKDAYSWENSSGDVEHDVHNTVKIERHKYSCWYTRKRPNTQTDIVNHKATIVRVRRERERKGTDLHKNIIHQTISEHQLRETWEPCSWMKELPRRKYQYNNIERCRINERSGCGIETRVRKHTTCSWDMNRFHYRPLSNQGPLPQNHDNERYNNPLVHGP